MIDRDEEIQNYLDGKHHTSGLPEQGSSLKVYRQLYQHLAEQKPAPVGFSRRLMLRLVSAKLALAERESVRTALAVGVLLGCLATLSIVVLVQMGWLQTSLVVEWGSILTRLPLTQIAGLVVGSFCLWLIDDRLLNRSV